MGMVRNFFNKFRKKSDTVSMAKAIDMAKVQTQAIEEFHQKATKDPILPRTKIKRLAISKKDKNLIQGHYSNRIAKIVCKTALNKREINSFGNFTPVISKWYLPRKAAQMK